MAESPRIGVASEDPEQDKPAQIIRVGVADERSEDALPMSLRIGVAGEAREPDKPARLLRVGVIAVQGAVSEHEVALGMAAGLEGLDVKIVTVRNPADTADLDGIVLPGGESTTIGRWLAKVGLDVEVRRLAEAGKGVMGTCAGLILLAREGGEQVERTATPLLGVLDISVDRNAFGGQRESFQAVVELEGVEAYLGVFIRAPAVVEVGVDCRVIGRLGERIVAVRQGNVEAYAFHPELGGDLRIHRAFVKRCAGQ